MFSNGKILIGVVYNKEFFDLLGEGLCKVWYEVFVCLWFGFLELVEGVEFDLDDIFFYVYLLY